MDHQFARDPKLISLHKHWITADAVSYHLRRSLKQEQNQKLSIANIDVMAMSHLQVLSVHYALLYVVVEGYLELAASDEKIDALLENTETVDSLRRFRNGTFHYQQNPLPRKTLDFFQTPDSENWIKELNLAFNSFFFRELRLAEVIDAVGPSKAPRNSILGSILKRVGLV